MSKTQTIVFFNSLPGKELLDWFATHQYVNLRQNKRIRASGESYGYSRKQVNTDQPELSTSVILTTNRPHAMDRRSSWAVSVFGLLFLWR
jgi:hypothetical protein